MVIKGLKLKQTTENVLTRHIKSTPSSALWQADTASERPEHAYDVTELRQELLENGYTPLMGFDKKLGLGGWSTLDVTPDVVKRWGRSRGNAATAVRLDNGLAAIDIDVDDAAFVALFFKRAMEAVPALRRGILPRRHSERAKEAWFFRLPDGRFMPRIVMPDYIAPGFNLTDTSAPAGTVEFFDSRRSRKGGATRYMCIFGPHSHEEAWRGAVTRRYGWHGLSLADVTLRELPILEPRDGVTLADIAHRTLLDLGWREAPADPYAAGKEAGEWLFDIPADARFECSDSVVRDLGQMLAVADHPREDVRCSMSWKTGARGGRVDRCMIHETPSGHLRLYDYKYQLCHVEDAAAPPDMDSIKEKLRACLPPLKSCKN